MDVAEQAGLDALEHDLDPAVLAARISAAYEADGDAGIPDAPSEHALWWTQGGTRVEPVTLSTNGLPEGSAFAAMIDSNWDSRRHARE